MLKIVCCFRILLGNPENTRYTAEEDDHKDEIQCGKLARYESGVQMSVEAQLVCRGFEARTAVHRITLI